VRNGAVNLVGWRLEEALTGKGRWQRSSGKVRRGPEFSDRRRWAGGSRGVSGCSCDWGKRGKGEERNEARHAVVQLFYTGMQRWGTVDESAPHDRRGPREREGRGGESRPTGGRRPASVAQPCHAASSTGEREGADRWAQTHSVGRLHRLTGGPGRIVPGLNKFQNNPYLIQTCPNLLQSKEDIRLLQNFEIKYGWKVFEIRNNFP
jgi:hypothetical protein